MRRLSAGLLLVLLPVVGCADPYEAPLSYGRCTGTELCGLETRCDSVAASTTGAPALVCTLPCMVDGNCPGLDGVCVLGVATTATDGGLVGRCLRACSADDACRPGTVCRTLPADAGAQRVCVANLAM